MNPELSLKQFESNKLYKRLSDCLTPTEFTELEESILYNKTPVTIPVWNNTILWNYPHYRICQRWKIPYNVEKYTFYNEYDATVEVCCTTLNNSSTAQIIIKYAYGTLYEAFKKISSECFITQNHFFTLEEIRGNYLHERVKSIPASVLSSKYPPSPSSFEDYYYLSKSINHILEIFPIMEKKIFSNDVSFSGRFLINLSKKNNNEIKLDLINFARKNNDTQLINELTKLPSNNNLNVHKRGRPKKTPLIKDMPTYDPDAEISSLTFTISAWCNSIIRAMKVSNINTASITAIKNLDKQLEYLITLIRKLRRIIKEVENEKR